MSPHRSTLARREMKEKDPEKYAKMREAGRARDNARNAEKKRKLAAGELTEEEMEVVEAKRLQTKYVD